MTNKYVYILSDYDEHGADHVAATLDRNRLPSLLKENWPEPTEVSHDAPKPYWRQDWHKQMMAKASKELDELLKKTDEELAVDEDGDETRWGLGDGWGGIVLNVVELK